MSHKIKKTVQPLTPRNEELVVLHMGVAQRAAKYFANRFRYSGIELEDFLGAAYLALCEAASRYDFNSPTSFKAFAGIRIRGAIYDLLRESAPIRHKVAAQLSANPRSCSGLNAEQSRCMSVTGSRKTPSRTLESLGICIHRIGDEVETAAIGYIERFCPEGDLERKESLQRFQSWIGILPEQEREVVNWRYLEGITFPEMAKRRGRANRSWYSRLHTRALDSLKVIIADYQIREQLQVEVPHV